MVNERRIVFRRAARVEFRDAKKWYETQKKGLGGEFAGCVEEVLQRISEQPELYPVVFEDIRQAPVSRFPYVVYYLVETERVVVISVFHASRNPKHWQSRR